jgi:probable O-glycosylation ligase (exosortase A-associated)
LVDRYDVLVNYEKDASAESRLWNWEFCKRVGLTNPLNGGGFDFYSNELYPIYYPEFIERWGPQKIWSCHSIWFTILGEHGLPGFILWIALMSSCFLSLRQMRSYGRSHPEMSWAIHCTDMLQAALVAFIVVGTFLDAAYFDMFYYLVAVIVIIKERMRHSPAGTSAVATVTRVDSSGFSSGRP